MDRIVVNPKILGGKPIIKGTRIPVSLVLEWLAAGMTAKEIVAEYSHLTEKDVSAAVHYAACLLEKEQVVLKKAS
jgi:uncharacterized protein (DUF433 family)